MVARLESDPVVERTEYARQQLAEAHSLPLLGWRAQQIAYWQREVDRLSQEPEPTLAKAA
jgi:hypothetical protein